MKILRFICWLKGYHESWFTVKAFVPNEAGGGHSYGEAAPCFFCGRKPPNGETHGAVLITWGDGK